MKPKNTGYFATGDKPDGKFAALWDDGAGARLFMPVSHENGEDTYLGAEGDWDEVGYDWFMDAGFLLWVRIPDNYKLWCERE